MRPKFSTMQNFFVVLLTISVFLIPFNITAQDQQAVIITADQPNIWTLEQAHYLLAQMHRRNLDLKANPLTTLDANEINGVNIDVLKTLLEVSAEYDQAKGFNNAIRKDQKQFDAGRRQMLLEKRSQLRDESLALTRQIAEYKIKKSQAEDESAKTNIQTQIGELEIIQAAVKEQITQVDAELATLPAASGDFEKTNPSGGFDKSKFPDTLNSAFTETVATILKGFNNSPPQLNASLRLENYLQMQYEILSKQLTLLRDEVGPGERLIFLEMPQSIRATYEKSNKKWAQSWWKIRAYTTCKEKKSAYEGVAQRIQDIVDESSDNRKTLEAIEKFFTDNKISITPEVSKKLSDAKDKFKLIGEKGKVVAKFGKETFSSLLFDNPQYKTERNAAKAEVEKMFTDVLKEIIKLRILIDSLKNDVANLQISITPQYNPKKEEYPKGASDKKKQEIDKKNAEEAKKNKDDEDKRIAFIKEKLKYFENELYKLDEIKNAYLLWLNLKIPDAVSKAFQKTTDTTSQIFVNSLESEIKKLLAFSDEEIQKLTGLSKDVATKNDMEKIVEKIVKGVAEELLSFPKAKETKEANPCKSSLEDYHDTSSVINTLINGDDNHKVEVVDLDDGVDASSDSPLSEILDKDKKKVDKVVDEDNKASNKKTAENKETAEKLLPKIENREARVIDLFPRQSSLNVNDIKLKQNSFSIRGVLSLISGFGANGGYQRSRERYSQFVQQELYAAAFGKGSREFGWTFFPMPGTDRLMSGVRTTYAIMVVPQKATTILLQTTGCYFQRSERQMPDFENALEFKEGARWRKKGQCSDRKSFIIPIPNAISGDDPFWVSEVKYQPVEPSKKVVVSIKGRDFSSQIGILVDGVPLKPSLGLGQPFIIDDSKVKDSVISDKEIVGSFERVDSNQIIASFEMGKTYKGTPTITLIAPGKGVVLNSITDLSIKVNVKNELKRFDGWNEVPYMFGNDSPKKDEIKIETIKIFKKAKGKDDDLVAVISGENLNKVKKIDVNGFTYCVNPTNANDCIDPTAKPTPSPTPTPTPPKKKGKTAPTSAPPPVVVSDSDKDTLQTETLIRLTFRNVGEKKLLFSLIDEGKTVQSGVDNPAAETAAAPTSPSAADYKPGGTELLINEVKFEGTKRRPNSSEDFSVFKLIGIGFKEGKMRVDAGEFIFIDDKNAYFEIEQSKTPLVITLFLTDGETKLKTRKEVAKAQPSPTVSPKPTTTP